MNIATNAIRVQKVAIVANIYQILSNKKENGEKLPTGRNITTSHLGAAWGLANLLATHAENHGNIRLETNRGNLAHALLCSPRSVYNYLLDFEQLNILHFTSEPSGENPDDMKIYINFSLEILTTAQPQGNRKTDSHGDSPLNANFATTNKKEKQKNTENSPSGCGKEERVKIEEEQKKEEQGQQKPVQHVGNADKMAGLEHYDLYAHFQNNEDFRALPADEQKEVSLLCNRLWSQAHRNLWNGRAFNPAVVRESVKLFAIALIFHANRYKAQRQERVREFCQSPHYLMEKNERYKMKWLNKFTANLPFELAKPYLASFNLLSRAVEIQRENCLKKNYITYYPTTYLADYFENAVRYAITEKRTMTTKKDADATRLDHCAAKMRIADAMAKGVSALKKFGLQFTLDLMRTEYTKLNKWLQGSSIKDKQSYLNRFLSQMNCFK